MKIYIELIFILFFILIFIIWKLWNNISKKNAIKKYKPENDKSRKGGIFNKRTIDSTKQGIDSELINLVGPEQSEGREFLQEAVVSDAGEDSNIPRENSKGINRLLGRNKK